MSNRLVDILAPGIQGPEGPYRCIYLDPPWPENGGGKSKRGADRHYKTMPVTQIRLTVAEALGAEKPEIHSRFPLGENLAHVRRDAHCWMWVTDNYLEDGLALMRMMGFDYKRTLVWAKVTDGNIGKLVAEACKKALEMSIQVAVNPMKTPEVTFRVWLYRRFYEFLNARKGGLLRSGLGHYARGAHELLLFGTRGKTHWPPTDVVPKSVQFAPITKHSAKPELFYDIIEACSPGPRLEMFARNARPGWAVFGNEVSDGQD